MALKPPASGLRRLRNDSKQVAKAQINVGPGDELEVSEDVAAQLKAASGAFKDAEGLPPFPDLNPAPVEDEATPKPAKRAAKKATPKTED